MADRFWSKVDRHRAPTPWATDGSHCWNWSAARTTNGYGAFGVGGKMLRAHRVAYEELVGPVPSGLELDHLCRNRACVNPAHLEPVTHRENMRRAIRSFGGGPRHCPSGHEFTPANTAVRRNGSRRCKACNRTSSVALRAKRRG